MLSRRRLTERAISAVAHRTCYLGQGSQKMLSRSRLTERAITDAFFFSSNFVVVALRAPWLNLYFYRMGVWKLWKILRVILWRWFWLFTIHRRVGARTSHLSSACKNVLSQLGAWKRPISARRVNASHLDSARENISSRAFVYRRCEQSLSRVKKLSHN